jgi:hypothetical protein
MNKKPAAKSKNLSLGIPAVSNGDGTDIASINATVFHILRKKKTADVSTYGLPNVNDDVFSRKIRLVKLPKKDALGPIEDIPDLEDVHHTDLPWIGQATFGTASRQFRSKNILACAVEVVREIDGYLYRLSVAIDEPSGEPLPPTLVYLNKATPLEREHTLVVNRDVTDEEREFYMADAPPVPMGLLKELSALGYGCTGTTFKLLNDARMGTSIHCELYGKILLAS